MATNTPRALLRKPAGSDNVDVTLDLNNNWDKVDGFLGVFICTSVTRPSGAGNVFSGMLIYETDTTLWWMWDGSVWQMLGNFLAEPMSTRKQIRWGSTTGLTGATGNFSIPSGFAGSLQMLVMVNGDAGARPNMTWGDNNTPGTTVSVKCWLGNTGAVIASASVRYNWIAVGSP